jgi:hypothetical protein
MTSLGTWSMVRNRFYERRTVMERFAAKVYHAPSGCWEWLGTRNYKGYGFLHMNDGPRTQGAHRVAYELFKGPIPEGLQIDHLCHNRGCVNPLHLQAVTGSVNQLRGLTLSKRLALRTHCNHGHEFTPENTSFHHGARRCKECHRIQARRRGHPERKRSA